MGRSDERVEAALKLVATVARSVAVTVSIHMPLELKHGRDGFRPRVKNKSISLYTLLCSHLARSTNFAADPQRHPLGSRMSSKRPYHARKGFLFQLNDFWDFVGSSRSVNHASSLRTEI